LKAILFPTLVITILLITLLKKYSFKTGGTPNQPETISGLTSAELASISIKPLLTPTELEFSKLLDEAMPEFRVMYQVAVYQTIKIKDSPENLKIWNKLNRLTFDFVLIDRESNVVAVIELDDKSHLRLATVKRDQKKDDLINFLGKPLLRFNVSSMPSVEVLRTDIQFVLQSRK
jgi:hypothetical protein